MYNVKSKQAEEFIDHQEILDTLDYALSNKNNRALIESLIERLPCAKVCPTAKLPCYWSATSPT